MITLLLMTVSLVSQQYEVHYFHANWCPACRVTDKQIPEIAKLAKVIDHNDRDFNKYAVRTIPMFIIVKRQLDKEILRTNNVQQVIKALRGG
jgi:thiol-disulfide isomerase/thioredoxin